MSRDSKTPRVAPESGRPAASDDPVTRRSTVPPGSIAEERAAPQDDREPRLDAGASEEEREALDALRDMGWDGAPFVTHRGDLASRATSNGI